MMYQPTDSNIVYEQAFREAQRAALHARDDAWEAALSVAKPRYHWTIRIGRLSIGIWRLK